MSNGVINHYLNIIKSSETLSATQEKDIILKAQKGNKECKSLLFSAYLKMVFKIARGYKIKNIFLEDLIAEGIVGLEDALKHFDLKRGYRFSTMARWWVRAKILSYIRKNIRIFEIPTATSDKIFAINKSIEKLDKRLNRHPKNEEIAYDIGLKESKVAFLRKFLIPAVSLNQTIDEHDANSRPHDSSNQTLQDLFEDDRDNSKEYLLRIDGINKVREALEQLPDNQRIIIEYRYGLKGKDLTLKQISKKMNLTTQRIHQIQKKAEIKLKRLIDV